MEPQKSKKGSDCTVYLQKNCLNHDKVTSAVLKNEYAGKSPLGLSKFVMCRLLAESKKVIFTFLDTVKISSLR